MLQFWLNKSIASQFIKLVPKAIYKDLALKYMKILITRKNGIDYAEVLYWDGNFQAFMMKQTGNIYE